LSTLVSLAGLGEERVRTIAREEAERTRVNVLSPTFQREKFGAIRKEQVDAPWFKKQSSISEHLFSRNPTAPKEGALELRPKKEDNTDTVQGIWTRRIPSINKSVGKLGHQLVLFDGHEEQTLGQRKPDDVLYLKNRARSEFHIVALGDNKARPIKRESFTDEDKQHLVDFLMELISQQPFRQQATGYLNNGHIIQFFRLTRRPESDLLEFTRELLIKDEGGQYLAGLLCTVPSELGYCLPHVSIKGQELTLSRILGRGGSAEVYCSERDGNDVAVKVFRVGREEDFRQELSTLQLLATNKTTKSLCGKSVPKIVHSSEADRVLVLSPVGAHFQTSGTQLDHGVVLSSRHLVQALSILKTVHTSLNLVHRDISLHNMFDVNGDLLLNDWGCATKVGIATEFKGALRHAPERILQAVCRGHEYVPQISDDLCMLWRCIAQSRLSFWAAIQRESDVMKLRQFWEQQSTPVDTQVLTHLAERSDYAFLEQQFSQHLPGATNSKRSSSTAAHSAKRSRR
jgi:hypothetical protein